MTAASADRNTRELDGLGSWPTAFTVKAAEILFAGVMLALDSTPELVEASDSAGLKVVGGNPKYLDNTADGKTAVPQFGVFKFENDGSNPVVAGDLIAYVKDDQTACASAGSTHKVVAGLVVAVESDGVWLCQTLEGLRAAQALHDLDVASASNHIADPAAQTQDALTDSSGGTPATTIAAIGGTYSQAEVANAIASLAAQLAKVKTDLAAARSAVVSILSALEAQEIVKTS